MKQYYIILAGIVLSLMMMPLTNYAQAETLAVSCSAVPPSANLNQSVTWTATATGGTAPYTYSWNGSVSGTNSTILTSYPDSGTKYATVKVIDAMGNFATSPSCWTTVLRTLTASCRTSPQTPLIGQTVDWRAQAMGGLSPYTYAWQGEVSGTTSTVSASYQTAGVKNSTVTITDSLGSSTTATCSALVSHTAPLVSCSASPTSPLTDKPVTWTAVATSGDGNYTYSWSGAATGTTSSVSATYASPGTKSAVVKVTSGGRSVTKRCSVAVALDVQGKIACVGAAVNTRQIAIDAAQATYLNSMNSIYTARTIALQEAYKLTTVADVKLAVKTAWSTFNTAKVTAQRAWVREKNAAWSRHRTAVTACQAPVGVGDGNNSGSELTGQ